VTNLIVWMLALDTFLYWLRKGRHENLTVSACGYIALSIRLKEWEAVRDSLGDDLFTKRVPTYESEETTE